VFNALWEKQGWRLLTNCKVVAIGCMEAFVAGPALLATQTNVWRGGVPKPPCPSWPTSISSAASRSKCSEIGLEEFRTQLRAHFNPAHYNQRRGAPT
jgi:hypothetical protein